MVTINIKKTGVDNKMITISVNENNDNIYKELHIPDNKNIKVTNINKIMTDDWGDDDCPKPVTTVSAITITIDKTIAHMFENVIGISFIRYDYYRPAYILNRCKHITKTKQPDGTIVFEYTS